MTDERYNALEAGHGELAEDELAQFYHYCPSWDGLLIAPHFGEFEFCECFDPKPQCASLSTGLVLDGPPF